MVAKVSVGRSFGGCLNYLFEGHKGADQPMKKAEVLAANGVRSESLQTLTTDFNRGRLQNADLGKAVWHTALAFHPSDAEKLNNEKMIALAKGYMEKLHIDPEQTQWVLIRHHDTPHPHAHLVVNRVQVGGATVSDQFCKDRSKEAAQQLAKAYGLTVASEKKKDLSLSTIPAMAGHDQARYAIFAAIVEKLPKVASLEELTKQLEKQDIQAHIQKNKAGKATGITFAYQGHFLKGSQIDRECSAGNLEKSLSANNQQAVVDSLRSRLSVAYQKMDFKARLGDAYQKNDQMTNEDKKVSQKASNELKEPTKEIKPIQKFKGPKL